VGTRINHLTNAESHEKAEGQKATVPGRWMCGSKRCCFPVTDGSVGKTRKKGQGEEVKKEREKKKKGCGGIIPRNAGRGKENQIGRPCIFKEREEQPTFLSTSKAIRADEEGAPLGWTHESQKTTRP